MLLVHNYNLSQKDLKAVKLNVSLTRQKSTLKVFRNIDPLIFDIHPYVVSFFLEKKIVIQGMKTDKYIFYWANKPDSLEEITQEIFKKYIEDKKNEDLQNLIRLESFFKLDHFTHLKTLKKQLKDCGIKAKQNSTWKERIITVFDQDFVFKEWGSSGKDYFRDWMKKNQLRILNNVVNSTSI